MPLVRDVALPTLLLHLVLGASVAPHAAAQQQPSATSRPISAAQRLLPLTSKQLLEFNQDFKRAHEAQPDGVPGGYDWFSKPKRGSWNTVPANHTALTGWGQAFWTRGTTAATAHLLVKNQMTLLCHGTPHRWSLVQSSEPVGANFRADFVGNVATRAESAGPIEAGASAVDVPLGKAYHFWPKVARALVPTDGLCGMLVLVQARAAPLAMGSYAQPNLLLGMGADYWTDRTAAWDHYKTNRDVAIGRLKLVGTEWAWYGLSTASDADLQLLAANGYADGR